MDAFLVNIPVPMAVRFVYLVSACNVFLDGQSICSQFVLRFVETGSYLDLKFVILERISIQRVAFHVHITAQNNVFHVSLEDALSVTQVSICGATFVNQFAIQGLQSHLSNAKITLIALLLQSNLNQSFRWINVD